MKKLPSEVEDLVRSLIRHCEQPLRWAMTEIEAMDAEDSLLYPNTVLSLMEIGQLKSLLGYKEPEGTTLEQIKLFNDDSNK